MFESTTGERAIVLDDWPQPTVIAKPQIYANDSSLIVRYRTTGEKIAVIRFPNCSFSTFGAPNDEALGGHKLSSCGLDYYSVHEVANSSLIRMLEQRNSVHHRHDRDTYLKDKKHFIFTFQDSTLECVANVSDRWKPTISIFDKAPEADVVWRRLCDG